MPGDAAAPRRGGDFPGSASFPALPGINIQDGLERFGGDTSVYKRILFKFWEQHADDAGKIREALDRGDFPEAQRLAHTLKGTAGTVGAQGLQAEAARFEAAIRQGEAGLTGLHVEIERALAEVVGSISGLNPPKKDEVPEGGAPGDLAARLDEDRSVDLDKLRHLLVEHDAGALELIQAIKSQTGGKIGAAFERVEAALQKYAFESALELLDQLREAIQNGHPSY
jgi:HPt (histidine-containing phosphotransfer) domain-containing protein